MELDTADHRRSSGVTSGLHRGLTRERTSRYVGVKMELVGHHEPILRRVA